MEYKERQSPHNKDGLANGWNKQKGFQLGEHCSFVKNQKSKLVIQRDVFHLHN